MRFRCRRRRPKNWRCSGRHDVAVVQSLPEANQREWPRYPSLNGNLLSEPKAQRSIPDAQTPAEPGTSSGTLPLASSAHMFTLRCTQKLLTRIGTGPLLESAPPDNVLGDWHANIVRVGRVQMVLAVSERTLLPVVVPAKDGRMLVERISAALDPLLLSIAWPWGTLRQNMAPCRLHSLGKRKVGGSWAHSTTWPSSCRSGLPASRNEPCLTRHAGWRKPRSK